MGDSTRLEDPSCNPADPKKLLFCDIRHAKQLLEPHIVKTPCVLSRLSKKIGMKLYLKNEFMQQTGCFKERGARYALMKLSDDQKAKGAVAASSGNHAEAMCYHGKELGIPVTVVMPEVAALMKRQHCTEFGGKVVIEGANMKEAYAAALKITKDTGATYINGYDNPDVLAGQGTIGIEILEQVPDVNAIVVPVGGGSLLAGTVTAIRKLKPCTKVIGVESVSCASFAKALSNGKPTFILPNPSLAEGLAVPTVGYNSTATVLAYGVNKMITVEEEDIAVAILRMMESEKFVVEGAGAVTLAAVLSGQLEEYKGKKCSLASVVLVLSGGNIDTTVLGRCLERGLAADGRLVKIYVTISDRPGGAAELCRLIAACGGNIKKFQCERAWITFDVFSVYVKAVCETRSFSHALELQKVLKAHYKQADLVHAPFPKSFEEKQYLDAQKS